MGPVSKAEKEILWKIPENLGQIADLGSRGSGGNHFYRKYYDNISQKAPWTYSAALWTTNF